MTSNEKRIEVEKTGDGYLVRLNNDNDKVHGWHSIFYQLPDRFTIIIPDPKDELERVEKPTADMVRLQDEPDEPPTVSVQAQLDELMARLDGYDRIGVAQALDEHKENLAALSKRVMDDWNANVTHSRKLLERIAALEGWQEAMELLRQPSFVRGLKQGVALLSDNPPAPAEPIGRYQYPPAPPTPKPVVDLDALEDRLIAAFVKDGYDIDGEACDTVRKVFRASRAAAKEASRE